MQSYRLFKNKIDTQYDEVLDILKLSIHDNYGRDEINDFLDIVEFKGGLESDLEKHLRVQAEREEKCAQQIRDSLAEERRKRRTTATIPELIHMEIHQAADEFQIKQREELREFLMTQTGQDLDGQQFLKMLEKSKVKFGPFVMKIAEDYVTKKQERLKRESQEKISFVKMEYFLFGVVEANECI